MAADRVSNLKLGVVMKRITLLLLASLFSSVVMGAQVLTPKLILDHLDVIHAQEMDGDELYFDISVYRANKPVHYLRVPTKPIHWSSKLINKVSQITLWSEPLKAGESVNVIVSLMESDDSLYNPDDLIGLVRVKLKNVKGVLKTSWTMPNRSDGPIKMAAQRTGAHKFDLQGKGAQYNVYLSLTK